MIRHALDQHDDAGGEDLRWALETSIRLGRRDRDDDEDGGRRTEDEREHMQNGRIHIEDLRGSRTDAESEKYWRSDQI